MSSCLHCGTHFSPATPEESFCCRGCEYVHGLIHHEGLDRFYELRGESAAKPARSVPFESHDFSWLPTGTRGDEGNQKTGESAEADFSLEGLSCVGCVWLVEKVFLRQPGALEAAAQPATGTLHLRWTQGQTDLPAFARELASFGYTLGPSRKQRGGETRRLGVKLGLCGAFAMNAMVFTLPTYVGMPEDFAFAGIFQLVAFLSATLSMLMGGTYFISRAWKSVRHGILHIDLPIALGILLAYGGSIIGWAAGVKGLLYFDFVSMFIFLMLGGRFLQLSAIERNRNRLQRQRPVPMHVTSPDRDGEVPLEDITPGLRFGLTPGQSVPVAATLDGMAADFSLEWINGEAEPVTFQPGRRLPAGAIHLGQKPVLLTAEETWTDSLLSRLADTRRDTVRVPALERLLRVYLLCVLAVGVGAFFWWLRHVPVAEALQVMISIFVVSCPCALGLALPFADELCGSIMERSGVFIRESLLWSRLKTVRTIIFDKTGTLTLERPLLADPGVIKALPVEGRLALARLTAGSLHPVSRSLLENLGHEGQTLLRAHGHAEIHDTPGVGRHFFTDDAVWFLGRPGWLSLENLPSPSPRTGISHDAELRRNDEVVACFRFHESLRPDAASALDALKRDHRLIILSGDRFEKVAAAAELLGIPPEDAYASLSPIDKEDIVRQLDQRDTLYLGDGANDSLAFNAAWATGTPVVDRSLLEAKADFFFMGHGLRFLPRLLSLARRRRQVVHIAFTFALVYNLCAISASALGHMNPLVAAIIMPLSSAVSLAIVTFGLRQREGPPPAAAPTRSVTALDSPLYGAH
ncbi:heavy metal translocating P-type ATPase metal-binding domain-containing protein [Luteolibacter sp. SL250]|uniref:heavy metal translocating P-type ATPase n=1 Tax=Luteolibacter sp. SL250 TaxID=2995170 RepID=UPI00226E0F27|nr:heavy metal translocating P-type ATPase metal-binding domain-containing protein [Luteolibacter sp. SL250]WAC21684.1 heavy metal translocating P-type ATPase metal-binding domain-containing protein [Luteolibacter sp. SL250]